MNSPALEVRDLVVAFRPGGRYTASPPTGSRPTSRGDRRVRPVNGVSLTLPRGGTLGLVGESGCGKTTLARAIIRLVPAESGSVLIDGTDLTALRGRSLRRARRKVQLVFQDPFASLNPRLTVAATLSEALAVAGKTPEEEAGVGRLLDEVGLDHRVARCYPHELSGGQRQRVAIARAVAVGPQVLIADEPTSSLDVPVQARILAQLDRIRRDRGMAMLLISHDLHLVRQVCRQVAVMYLGRIVESFPVAGLEPRHPYSRVLAAATPSFREGLAGVWPSSPPGEVPSLLFPPSGCPFHPRCRLAEPSCREALPDLEPAGPEHLIRCPVAAPGTE